MEPALLIMAAVAYLIAGAATHMFVNVWREEKRMPWAAEVPIGVIILMFGFGTVLLLGGLGMPGPL